MSVLDIYGLDVLFPYPRIYPEQREYMGQLKLSFDNGQSCVLELPSGTGKSIALFSLILAYMEKNRNIDRLVVCVNSLPAMDLAIQDFKFVHERRLAHSATDFDTGITAVPFLSRAASCLHEPILKQLDIVSECITVTLPWAEEPCPFFSRKVTELPRGVVTVSEFREFCRTHGECPHFLARRLVEQANVIFCTTRDLVDPRRGECLRSVLSENSIVVLDDATCIDNVCCDVLSHFISEDILKKAKEAVWSAKKVLERAKEEEQDKLRRELELLRGNLSLAQLTEMAPETLDLARHPVIPEHRAQRPIPGSLRNPDVFIDKIHNLIAFFRKMFAKMQTSEHMSSSTVLTYIEQLVFIEPEILHFLGSRLVVFFVTHQLTDFAKYAALWRVLDFVTVLSTYEDNIGIYMDAATTNRVSSFRPNIQLACHDASLAFSQVLPFKRFVLTGSSLSPLAIYNQMLGFEPISVVGYVFSRSSRCRHFLPIIVARGTDQTVLTSEYAVMSNHNGVNNYGRLISGLAKVVPDGIVVFFPSFNFMQEMIAIWSQSSDGVIPTILQHKLLFIETQNQMETSLMIDNHKRAIDTGRGSVFFGVATGRAVDGVDFSGRYARCCLLFGMPMPHETCPLIEARSQFLEAKFGIAKKEFLMFNSVRLAMQTCNKILNSKQDYCITIFADVRYDKPSANAMFPRWISQWIARDQRNQSVDDAIEQAKRFYLDMTRRGYLSDESDGVVAVETIQRE